MTPTGIEPATFRFVAQNLNHCATAVGMYVTHFIVVCMRYLLNNTDYCNKKIALLLLFRMPIAF